MSAVAAKTDQRVRVALVGAGVIGPIHGQVLSELADRMELVAVVDHELRAGASGWPRSTAASRSTSLGEAFGGGRDRHRGGLHADRAARREWPSRRWRPART